MGALCVPVHGVVSPTSPQSCRAMLPSSRVRVLLALCTACALALLWHLFSPRHVPPAGAPVLQQPQLVAGDPSCACDAAADAAWAVPEGVAVLVEPRALPSTEFALRHTAAALPAGWQLLLVQRGGTWHWVSSALGDLLATGKLAAWELDEAGYGLTRRCASGCASARVEAGTMRRSHWHSGTSWAAGWPLANEVQVRPELYSALPAGTDALLVFQSDGLLCDAPANASALREFAASYDYVGAPWPLAGWGVAPYHPSGSPAAVGGNGGLSLRSRAAMLRAINAAPWDGENEDAWLSRQTYAMGGRLPSYERAGEWGFEGVLTARGGVRPLGFHKPWIAIGQHFTASEYGAFAAACPAAERAHALLAAEAPPPSLALRAGIIAAAAAAAAALLLAARRARAARMRAEAASPKPVSSGGAIAMTRSSSSFF